MDPLQIRESKPTDAEAVLQVEREAFGRDDEASLVSALLSDPGARPYVSLLAIEAGQPVGHALFTNARLLGAQRPVHCSLLAPLAVSPNVQRRGIGSRLIAAGLGKLREFGVELVFVFGSSDYYRRAGFMPARGFGLQAPFPIPEAHADSWMALALDDRPLGSVTGTVRCAASLSHPEFWRE
ncbi:MAG: N-acetyltransferase [Thiohalocapsa sp.]|nr:N-acetyltransferase [Thiohalocapsa sp.]MCF7990147.1 N-acetyltransferase [Thiohalocapsa sp.]